MNILTLLLFIALIGSMWLLPSTAPVLGIVVLLFSLAIAISSIFKKYKQTENSRSQIAKDVLILVTTLLLSSSSAG